ncbi:hypothetical protein C7A11_23290 [Pseudomonas simiae]|jgi:hypothetical protein|uniref:hypothetical protein n=1 Tax=Pseudomonas simiae TaxID=321846 RepID=UPI000D033900|nr:hypothetical protein [Pseudomonas simiae]PRW85447.1 hypothetical protein C7A11_23290 [Pseudomonas simiae]
MSDYTDLQKAAEYAAQDAIKFADEDEEMRALQQFHEEVTPETVRALIAENKRVKARLCVCRDCGGQGEVYSGHSSYQGHNQPPEPDMDVCGTCGGDGVLGPLEDFESLAVERDQLKAENEALRKSLLEAAEEIDTWGAYASDYFQEKHDLAGCVAKFHAAAMGKGEQS